LKRLIWCLVAGQLGACAPMLSLRAGSSPAPTPTVSDTLLVIDIAAERALDDAVLAARWRLLRALDEQAAGRFDPARLELDGAYHLLAAIDDSPSLNEARAEKRQAEADAVADAVERAYLSVLPHIERLSPDSPLTLLLGELGDEYLEQLPEDTVPLVRIHQLSPRCDLPIDANEQVAASIHFFQTRGRETWTAWMRRSGRYREIILPILRKEGLPEDLLFLAMIESGFNPRAYSRAHAVGLWQFMSATGKREGLTIDHWVDERRDPVRSTKAAATHLRGLYKRFGDWRLAAAAYNSGSGRVRRAIDKAGSRDFWALDLPRETRNYVPLLMAAAVIAKSPETFGFQLPEPEAPIRWDEVQLKRFVHLETASGLLGPKADLRQLNPELRRPITPPMAKNYHLKVPPGTGKRLLAQLAKLPASAQPGVYEYAVQRGDNLWTIARAFGVSSSMIADANDVRGDGLIRPGQTLYIPVQGGRPPANGLTHSVRSGESLWTIAKRFGTSVADLRRWNGLTESVIRPGQKLTVGSQPTRLVTANRRVTTTDDRGRPTHQVRDGESLWSIARQYDVRIHQLRTWNALPSSLIKPGQQLYVSGAEEAVSIYTVVRGDTLYSIARKFGLDANDIAQQNNMNLTSTLLTGTELRIRTAVD
jgi:membrane-bound lytic murein transglycosylase D